MKRTACLMLLVSSLVTVQAFSQDYKEIYPFKPFDTKEIEKRVKRLSEDGNALLNLRQINNMKLHAGETATAPWTAPYWHLKEGMIANPYQERGVFHYVNFIPRVDAIKPYEKRRNYIMSLENQLTEEELAALAPSEKYDLLMGNGLDLSNRVWDFIVNWKDDMKWNYLRAIDLPSADYEIEKKNYIVANWEGICHGWAPAAGVVPKPVKNVYASLPDGRKITFYPQDIKGLISLTWANSLVQDNVLSEGLRCKRRFPKKDEYGRYYDTIPENGEILPRCADIHPAVLHLTLVNVIGKQKRSLIIDKAAGIAVSNQPVKGYSFKYFHPITGEDATFEGALADYSNARKDDKYWESRNPDTAYIVGVESTIVYADWAMIRKPDHSKVNEDKYSELVSLYDLELDAQGNVIGGQWRGYKDLIKKKGSSKMKRPDFLWVVPKDYRRYFEGVKLSSWDITSGEAAPQEWKNAAEAAHSFFYENSKKFGNAETCKVKHKETGEVKEVPCEFRYPRPQPLVQVVDQLIELSK